MDGLGSSSLSFIVVLVLVLNVALFCNGGKTSSFVRKAELGVDMPLSSDVFQVPPGYNAPQQVHITQGDHEGRGMIVSWVTMDEPGSNTVIYWSEKSTRRMKAEGQVYTYKFYDYTSGYIHHCTITNLKYNTKYYYVVGIGHTRRKFWFLTPPPVGPDAAYTFGIIGDLGQTYDSNLTLTHYERNFQQGKTVLFLGDLSYADRYANNDGVRWDTWGRFVERRVAYEPWIWTVGNHEIELNPILNIETTPFKPYTHRYHVPHEASSSIDPLWYSIKRASAYIIVLSSYSAFSPYSPQWLWLQLELQNVDRSQTPWLIVLMHAPLYNSYYDHYMEGEPMRVVFEPLFVQFKVDVVFSGHVHAYERSERVSNIAYNITNGDCTIKRDQSAPVYITIGDGGISKAWLPNYSAYREASFGHAIFDIKNRTHAYYSWHRNRHGYSEEADSMWFYNRYWYPFDDSTASIQSSM
ncbi:unnamed protein product [Dovyalis caffra]|uniref:Purple acid phosphatase n=1 Tax=Dovyalis caffra TaxID=77055 RepID=A0AAV1R7A6_9ROSI|nr:unnamed protein product [Dovyalis caffra]